MSEGTEPLDIPRHRSRRRVRTRRTGHSQLRIRIARISIVVVVVCSLGAVIALFVARDAARGPHIIMPDDASAIEPGSDFQ
jgi:hypothetical protein